MTIALYRDRDAVSYWAKSRIFTREMLCISAAFAV